MTQMKAAMCELAVETAKWFIQKLRANGICSPADIETRKRELGQLTFEKFQQYTDTQKFVVALEKAEPFFRDYLGKRGFREEDIEQLISASNYVDRATIECKVFQFVQEIGGEYHVYYIALLVQDGKVYVAMTCSQFQFKLPTTYTGWWIFSRKHYTGLTLDEKNKLDSFFLYEALQCFHGSMEVNLSQLSDEDQKFLTSNS